MPISIGETIFRFDINRRQYAKPPRGSGRISGDLIYAYHFEPYSVVAQTPQSWKCRRVYDDGTLARETVTVNKKTMIEAGRDFRYRYYTDAEKYQREWLHLNKPGLYQAVQTNDDYTVWLSIAKLLNIKTKDPA